MNNALDKPATFNPGRESEACGPGEAPMSPHWSQMLLCSDGRFVHGYGATKDEAERNASFARITAEEELAMPPRQQIRAIINRCTERIYDADIQRLLRLLVEIVGNEND